MQYIIYYIYDLFVCRHNFCQWHKLKSLCLLNGQRSRYECKSRWSFLGQGQGSRRWNVSPPGHPVIGEGKGQSHASQA